MKQISKYDNFEGPISNLGPIFECTWYTYCTLIVVKKGGEFLQSVNITVSAEFIGSLFHWSFYTA